MKIYITKEQPKIQDEEILVVHPDELDKIENASCTLVKLGDTLDFYTNRFELLGGALSKLRYGATLSMEGVDIGVLTRSAYNGRYSNQELNDIIYRGRASVSDLDETKRFLLEHGMTIKVVRYEDHKFYLEAERPKPSE